MRPNENLKRSSILPSSLTDKELVRFADRYYHTCGIPSDFQHELLKRFAERVDVQQ